MKCPITVVRQTHSDCGVVIKRAGVIVATGLVAGSLGLCNVFDTTNNTAPLTEAEALVAREKARRFRHARRRRR